MISRKDLYAAIIQMVIHAETISWNRFYNFLMGNSVLVVAWAAVFSSQAVSVLVSIVLSVICLFGVCSGIVWAELGKRSREHVDKHFNQGRDVEKDPKSWEENAVADSWKPFIG